MISLYTRIPVPLIEWNGENTKYVLTVLPFSGLLIGAAEAVWLALCLAVGLHAPLYAAVACVIPLLVNGGIHLDGLADTVDACSSYASPVRKREILHDPHIGAFGSAGIVLHELMTFGVFCEIYVRKGENHNVRILVLLLLAFIVPRVLVQVAVSLIPPAVPDGMLFTLTSVADKRLNLATALGVLMLCTAVVFIMQGWAVFAYVAALILLFLYFRRMVLRQFGGISGDLCGWLIKVSETVLLVCVLFTLDKWLVLI